MAKLAKLLESVYGAPPPDPMTEDVGGYASLASVALRMRGLGREGFRQVWTYQ